MTTPLKYLPPLQLTHEQVRKKILEWFSVWPNWQKEIVLSELTTRCKVEQLQTLTTSIEPLLHQVGPVPKVKTTYKEKSTDKDKNATINKFSHDLSKYIVKETLQFFDKGEKPLKVESTAQNEVCKFFYQVFFLILAQM